MKPERSERYASEQERNARLERGFNFEKGNERGMSTLAFVSVHAEVLAREYVAGFDGPGLFDNDSRDPSDEAALRQWERQRFGGELEPAAHGILRHAVSQARKGNER